MTKERTFEEWISEGVDAGWVTLPVCGTHSGAPMLDHEIDMLYNGDDPCVVVMRVWGEKGIEAANRRTLWEIFENLDDDET